MPVNKRLTKSPTYWIGSVVVLSGLVGVVVGLGTGSVVWGVAVTVVAGCLLVGVISLM